MKSESCSWNPHGLFVGLSYGWVTIFRWLPSGKLTLRPWKSPIFRGNSSEPTPTTTRVYVNFPMVSHYCPMVIPKLLFGTTTKNGKSGESAKKPMKSSLVMPPAMDLIPILNALPKIYVFSRWVYMYIHYNTYIYISPSVLFSSFDQFDLLREIEDRIMAIIKAGNYEVTINELPCTSPRSAVYIQDFPPHSLWFPVTCSRDNERGKSCWNNDTMPFYKW